MTVLDASALIAYFGADTQTVAAAAILERSTTLHLHPVTLAEVLTGPAATGAELAVLSAIHELGIEIASPVEQEPLLVARLGASTRLKLPDCYPLAEALLQNVTLATFDTHLAATARDLGVTVVGA